MRDDERTSRPRAKAMRREMTKAEFALWMRLREANRHGYKFRRQHPIGPYSADFAHVRGMLVIEIDGETHGSPEEIEHDRRRDEFLRGRGWTVIRFPNVEVHENVDGLVEHLTGRLGPHPAAKRRPTSPAKGGRG